MALIGRCKLKISKANVAAWNVLKNGGSALDAVTAGTSRCEGLGYANGSKIESGTAQILSQNRRSGYL